MKRILTYDAAKIDYHTQRWFDRAQSYAERLENRIETLKGAFYPGCGFHYSKEQGIQRVKAQLVELRHDPYNFLARVGIEGLAEDVATAEYFATHQEDRSWEDDPRPCIKYSCNQSRRARRKMLAEFRAKHPHRKAVRSERPIRSSK